MNDYNKQTKATNFAKNNVAGVVVLYDSPADEVIANVKTYINQIDKLYAIDNSPEPNRELVEKLIQYPQITYYAFGTNKGIAAALNWGANKAIEAGYALLLTMDDDTTTPPDMIKRMLDFWNTYSGRIGLVSGVHHKKHSVQSFRYLPYTLTSGNLLNLHAFKEVGEFLTNLFIDHVDHEYGLRLNKSDYKVIELTTIQLNHNLGYRMDFKIGKWNVRSYGTHSAVRLYYFARNGVFVARLYAALYPFFIWMVIKEVFKRIIKAVFLHEDSEKRLNLLWRGFKDGWKGRLGKL